MAKEETPPEEPPKSSSKKMLIIIVAVVLVVVLGGVGAFLALKGKSEAATEEEGSAQEEGEEQEEVGSAPPAVLPLDTFIVNLQVKGSFLKTTIQLQFGEPELPPTVETDVPKIRDTVIRILSSRSSVDILTGEGKEKLKEEIKTGINEVLGAEDVTDVYFTEFIIQ